MVASINEPKKIKAIAIICHGLTGNKVGPQQLQTKLANYLMNKDILAVNFDFRNSGDSSGNFANITITSMLEDVRMITEYLIKRYSNDNFFYIGLSIGSIISTMYALDNKAKANIIISSDLKDDIKPPYRKSIRDGAFYLNDVFWDERSIIQIRKKIIESTIPTVLLYGKEDYKVVKCAFEMSPYIRSYAYEGVDHLFGNHNIRLKLFNDIVNYIYEYLGDFNNFNKKKSDII